jgi:hypothetical protein
MAQAKGKPRGQKAGSAVDHGPQQNRDAGKTRDKVGARLGMTGRPCGRTGRILA